MGASEYASQILVAPTTLISNVPVMDAPQPPAGEVLIPPAARSCAC